MKRQIFKPSNGGGIDWGHVRELLLVEARKWLEREIRARKDKERRDHPEKARMLEKIASHAADATVGLGKSMTDQYIASGGTDIIKFAYHVVTASQLLLYAQINHNLLESLATLYETDDSSD